MVDCRCGCSSCYDTQFDQTVAEADLREYRRAGPRRTTRMLLDAIRAEGVRGASLLDVGGGIGVVQHELMAAGLDSAVQIDAAEAFLRVARAEAERQQTVQRTTFLHGDFVDVASKLEPADIVTLDRVICCYPDCAALVDASASRTRRLYGIVIPRDAWWTHVGNRLSNTVHRLRRRAFRTFVHPVSEIDTAIRRHGLRLRQSGRTAVWQVLLYAR